ncbi:methyl-accepting chemotaxis protein [Rhodoferax ferrireducens]|uniref:methyl-accepting chemotaxis protein n=1 Tax=Rhodoferax ferrireducens TaxID=192843 RepID=UPI000E0DF78E|nr:methyl-accepting chemotaxis protein [Rhodoferax ferrireducens]
MSHTGSWSGFKVAGSFSQRILGVLALVLAVALVGSGLGVWSLYRVSQDTGRMVNEAMATESLAEDLHRNLSVNVARSKAFALSSEPQVGDVLSPEIDQTSAVVAELLQKLGTMLVTPEDQTVFRAMTQANNEFLKARQDLTVARDGGLTANIEQVYASRFTPAAQALMAAVTRLGDAQRARIDVSVLEIGVLSRSAQWGLILFGACALLLGSFLSIWLVRGVTRPIQQAVDTANRVAALDLSERIEGHDRDEGGRLLAALGRMQVSLHTLVSEVQGASHTVAEGATQIAAGNLDFSSRTELAASFLQQTAAAVEEITTTMHHSMEAATRGEALAISAATAAAGGNAAISGVMQTMNDISASSREIVDITAVIDSIAFQTNILALNAAVEAARAGDQGRGFAVVAAEVRTLANRSAQAARQIKALIGASVDTVKLGMAKVSQARDTMSTINDSVERVAHAIAEITVHTRGQSSSMSSINAAVNRLDQMTQQNAAVVEESAAAAQSLQNQAGDLRDVAGRFRLPGLALLALR